jgi:hypothetical protein
MGEKKNGTLTFMRTFYYEKRSHFRWMRNKYSHMGSWLDEKSFVDWEINTSIMGGWLDEK